MSEMSADGCGVIKKGRADHNSQPISCSRHCQLGMAYKRKEARDNPALQYVSIHSSSLCARKLLCVILSFPAYSGTVKSCRRCWYNESSGEDSYKQRKCVQDKSEINSTHSLCWLPFTKFVNMLQCCLTNSDLSESLPVSFLTGCSRTLMVWWVSSGEEGSERDTPSMMRMCCMPSVMEREGTE